MGFLILGSFLLPVCLFIGLIIGIIGFFVGQIILFDSMALGIVAGVCCNHFFHIHPALCLVIGIVVCILLFLLQNTTVGFWLIGGLFTLLYAAFFGVLAILFTNGDWIWGWVVFGLSIFIIAGLHFKAREPI